MSGRRGNPRIVVAMGRQVQRQLGRLDASGLIRLPIRIDIPHYVYFASRPEGTRANRPPNDPERRQEYIESIRQVRRRLDELRS